MAKAAETLSSYLLKVAVRESGRKSTVQLVEEFARTTKEHPEGTPALARLLVMGEASLWLYLTLVMMTAAPQKDQEKAAARPLHRETAPSHFAEMFGYDDLGDGQRPPGPGTRRIVRAMQRLHEAGFIELTKEPGHHPKIGVFHPGSGVEVRPPYITLPIQLWQKGWVTAMSARALTVYTALRLVAVGKQQGEGAHVPPYEQARFGLSPDTWQRGTKDLVGMGLLEIRPGIVDTRGLRSRHRNVYFLNFDRVLNEGPTDPSSAIVLDLS